MGCAQIKVTGSGAGTPGPTVKFPGAYDPKDPGILVNMCKLLPLPRLYLFHFTEVKSSSGIATDYHLSKTDWPPLRQYTPPGPKTWPVACDDSTVNVLGQESDGDCTPLEESAQGDPVTTSAAASATAAGPSAVSSAASTSSAGVAATPVAQAVSDECSEKRGLRRRNRMRRSA